MTMQRHIGKMKNTDQRVVVVFMQLPTQPDRALVVAADNLPMMIGDALMNIVNSPEGQAETTLANVLDRRLAPDGSGSVLNALHNMKLLLPVSIDDVIMTPTPSRPIPLRDVLKLMPNVMPIPDKESTEQLNRFQENAKIAEEQTRRNQAEILLREAADFDYMAAQKRKQAYVIDPSLDPANAADEPAPASDTENSNT